MSSAPRSITVGVGDLNEALELFHRRMDLDMESSGDVPTDVLRAWGLPQTAKACYALLSRDRYPAGKLRLVEWNGINVHRVRTDHLPGGSDSAFDIGPKSVDFFAPAEIEVSIALLEREGYPAVYGPVRYAGSNMAQVIHAGPDGMPMMVMTRPAGPSPDMRADLPPDTYSEIVTISLITESRVNNDRFYGELLGLTKRMDGEASPSSASVVAELTGVPQGTRVHYQMFVEKDQPSAKFVIVQYPGGDPTGQGKRLIKRMKPGALGLCLLSFERPNLDAFVQVAVDLGFEVEHEPNETTWGRLALVRGPNEELIEIKEKTHD